MTKMRLVPDLSRGPKSVTHQEVMCSSRVSRSDGLKMLVIELSGEEDMTISAK